MTDVVEQWLVRDVAKLRPDPDGGFDELLIFDECGGVTAHAEMMDDKSLVIMFYPPGGKMVRLAITSRGKLRVMAEDD